MILETTFLIDLERERRADNPGSAHRFIQAHAEDAFYLTFTIAGELAAGASLSIRDAWERFLAPFHILATSREVEWQYAEAYRHLQANGMLIGANDLWIAATALAHDIPLVTRNLKHFRRVPGLEIVSYGS